MISGVLDGGYPQRPHLIIALRDATRGSQADGSCAPAAPPQVPTDSDRPSRQTDPVLPIHSGRALVRLHFVQASSSVGGASQVDRRVPICRLDAVPQRRQHALRPDPASTQSSTCPRVSAPCLASPAMAVLPCLAGLHASTFLSCLPSNGFYFPFLSRPSRPHRYYAGSDSSPARTPGRSLCLLRSAVRTSRPQPRHGPVRRPLITQCARPRFATQASPWVRKLAAPQTAEIGFVSCGLLVRLRLLPTPPRGDAVAFGYMWRNSMGWTFTSRQINIADARSRVALGSAGMT